MQQDITVLLDHDPPVRGVPTPPDPIPRLADSSLGKLLSLTIMEFDGTLPADSLEPPFRVVWPGGRSVDIRPKSSGGMRAALKRRGGIPVGGAKGKEGATNSSSSGNVDAPLAGPSRNAAQAGPSQSILSSPPPSPGGTQHELHEAINGSIYDVLMNGFEGYSTDDPVGAGPSTALEATLDETLRDLGDNPELGQWLDSHPLETLDTLPADSLAANSLPPHLDVTSQQNQPASPAGTGCARPAGKPRPRRVSLEIQPSGKTQREPLTTPTPASQMAPPRRTSVGAVSRNPSVPPSPISRPSSSVEYLGSSSPLKRSLPDDTDTSAPVMENRGASRSKPALHKGTSMTKSTATTRLARSKTSAATKPSASTRAIRASSSRPAARSARAAVAAMVKEPYPTIVEEQPRKRRRTERSVSIPQRAEILLPMSDGKRYGREGKWPKFSKDWNNWRMLKEIICDKCNGRVHWPCAGLMLDSVLKGKWYCPDCQFLIDAGRVDEILPARVNMCSRHDCCRRRKQKMNVNESDEDEYYISRVIGRRAIRRKPGTDERVFEYLVEWHGYSIAESTWEPEDNIHEDKDGTRPHVDAFLRAAKKQAVNTKGRVALLDEPEVHECFDTAIGVKIKTAEVIKVRDDE